MFYVLGRLIIGNISRAWHARWNVCGDDTGYECMWNLAQKQMNTHTHTHAIKVCVTGGSGSTLSAWWYKWVNVCVCVCVGMFMLLSANSSSAACPAPCKDQTPCLLEERQKPDWLCFLYSAIKRVTWPTCRWPSMIMTLTSSAIDIKKDMLASAPLNKRRSNTILLPWVKCEKKE